MPIFLAAFSVFYAFLAVARYWFTPVTAQAEIDLRPSALPAYAMFSVMRIAISYLISLVFSVAYGYIAAYNRKAERVMIPLLDTLQSIPVLSFLPGVMLAMVALFPRRQLGIELGSILLIFTGQAWNMAFSFYSSLKSIPREMHEVAEVYRWSPWQKLMQMELPFSAIGLVWNSMVSVAAAWFYLIACEMFVLRSQDFRIPGLGSYLQTAANAADTRAIVWGLGVMIGVIVAMDQLIWRPVIAWAEKFKFEQVGGAEVPHSAVLDLLRGSRVLPLVARLFANPAREYLNLRLARNWARRRDDRPAPSGGPLALLRNRGRRCACRRLCRREDERPRSVGNPLRAARHLRRRRRHSPARRVDSAARRALDHSRRRHDRIERPAVGHDPAHRSSHRLGARHGPVSHHRSSAHPRRRRAWPSGPSCSCFSEPSGTSCSTSSPERLPCPRI